MRILLVLIGLVGLAAGQSTSHPSWWTYAPSDSTALIGIQWERVRESPFEQRLRTELSPKGWLGFPDLTFLNDRAERVLIASPFLMAIEFGSFPKEVVSGEAQAKGLKQSAYKGVELWSTAAPETMSVAWISEQIVLVGHLPTLKEAIDRSMSTEAREFSPLLARAGKHSDDDLWVVSGVLPDPVVGRFLPLNVPAVSFDGGLHLRDGLHVEATIEAKSEAAADSQVDQVWKAIDPALFGNTQMFTDAQNILLKIDLTPEQLASAAAPPEAPVVEAVIAPPPKPVRPKGPQVVRIQGLEDGPREIVVSGAK